MSDEKEGKGRAERAKRLREDIRRVIEQSEAETEAKPRKVAESARDFVHRRMRESGRS